VPGVSRLVVTVGGSPVPVLLTLLGLRPARVTAVVSQESTPVWTRLWQAYRGLAPDAPEITPKVVVVPPFDVAAASEAVHQEAREFGGPFHLGYSGGSPAMSAGAFGAWWSAYGASASGQQADLDGAAWYVAEEGDALVRHEGVFVEARDILAGRSLTLAAMVELHGLEPAGIEARPDRWEPHSCALDPRSARKALRQLAAAGEPRELPQLNAAADSAVLDALTLIGDSAGVTTYGPTRLVDHPTDDRPRQSIELGICVIDGLTLKMVTVAAYRRHKAAVGDIVTRRWSAGQLKEALFDAEVRARRAGGIRVDTGLLSLEVPQPNRRPVVEALWRDIGPLSSPPRLESGEGEGEPPLPSTTAFSLNEVYEALKDLERGTDPVDGNDLARWLGGVTE
jgi:hypothetical protein